MTLIISNVVEINAAQRQLVADLWTKPIGLSHMPFRLFTGSTLRIIFIVITLSRSASGPICCITFTGSQCLPASPMFYLLVFRPHNSVGCQSPTQTVYNSDTSFHSAGPPPIFKLSNLWTITTMLHSPLPCVNEHKLFQLLTMKTILVVIITLWDGLISQSVCNLVTNWMQLINNSLLARDSI